MLKIEGLGKSFGDLRVLKDLDLEMKDGSVLGLVGINGAGKSTLLRCISGVYTPDCGRVLLDGFDTCRNAEIRRKIAFVSDEVSYPAGATARSQKLLYEMLYEFDEQAYEKYLALFDIDENKLLSTLSKGMKRRVALVFALSVHAKLILLDEAYDGLEPIARLRFKQVLSDLIVDEGVSVMIASHNLRELEDICDSFGILGQGRIESYGDLLDKKANMQKYQCVFEHEIDKDMFKDLEILHMEIEGRVCRLVVEGDREKARRKLMELKPMFLDELSVGFEEIFMYEVAKGESHD